MTYLIILCVFLAGVCVWLTLKKQRLEILLEQQTLLTQEKIDLLSRTEARLTDTFKALSSDALKNSAQSFLELATAKFEKLQEGARVDLHHRQKAIDEVLKPIKESLHKSEQSQQELRKTMTATHVSLSEQVKQLSSAQSHLTHETSNLVKALRAPAVRGRWGEMQLKRVVEIAGMLDHCDFVEQKTVQSEDGRLRPDMVVNLPGGKQIVVDSKAPLQGFLDAIEAKDDEGRKIKMLDHSRQVRAHITKLASKSYWDQFKPAPEFVVLFLPGETFFGAALENDPALIEYGVEQKVIIATPTTLISLLRSVAYGWQQELIAENAQEISRLGKELYERVSILAGHFIDIKKGVEKTIEAYNKGVASFETRVLVTARKLKEAGAGTDKEIEILEPVDKMPRALTIIDQ